MSLATRCTACGTAFRVAQDQLEVSQGWVRCGRCQGEFNAHADLFELELDVAATPASQLDATSEDTPTLSDSSIEATPGAIAEEPEVQGYAAFFGPRLKIEIPDETDGQPHEFADSRPAPSSNARIDPPPSFMQQTKNDVQQRRRGTGTFFWYVALLLGAGLFVQCAVHFRDTLVVQLPAAHPMLDGLCRLAQCKIDAPRRIDDVVVESSALTRVPGGDVFRLAVALRNRGATVLAVPSVELTLTDSSGQVLARRTIAPADFYASPKVLMPATETPMRLVFAAATTRTTGYTVEAFYP